MSDLLSEACNDLLALGILEHEHGVPVLWQKSTNIQKSGLEELYYNLNRELATQLNELVRLNKLTELQKLPEEAIDQIFTQTTNEDLTLRELPQEELEDFLKSHTNAFKTDALMNDYLAMALPVLRAVYHGNLTESEFSVLNNLKKLYSHYNNHPANISRLMRNYKKQDKLYSTRAELSVELDRFLATTVTDQMTELKVLNDEYSVLQNTYKNQIYAQSDASERFPELRRISLAVGVLSKRLAAVSVLCDFLPNLVLCQATNWYNDKTLRSIIEDCQDTAETLPSLKRKLGMSEILETDFEKISADLSNEL